MTPSASGAAAAVDSAAENDDSAVVQIKQHAVQQPNGATCRRIQVSREKRPVHFFVALAKKFLSSDAQIELSGLGLAVVNVVTIAELLREESIATIDEIRTSLVEPTKGHSSTPKAKIQIWLTRIEQPHDDNCANNHQQPPPEHAGDTNPPLSPSSPLNSDQVSTPPPTS